MMYVRKPTKPRFHRLFLIDLIIFKLTHTIIIVYTYKVNYFTFNLLHQVYYYMN